MGSDGLPRLINRAAPAPLECISGLNSDNSHLVIGRHHPNDDPCSVFSFKENRMAESAVLSSELATASCRGNGFLAQQIDLVLNP